MKSVGLCSSGHVGMAPLFGSCIARRESAKSADLVSAVSLLVEGVSFMSK